MAVLAQDLRDAVLQYALQGKLTEQLDADSSVEELLAKIKAEKEQLIKDKKIKKEKALPEIEDDEIPFAIPNNWCWSRLGNLFHIERGASPRPIEVYITEDKDGVNWIKIGDTIAGEKYVNSTKEKITSKGAEKSRFVKKGDFIFSNSMSFGRPYILNIDGCIHDGWNVIHNIEIMVNGQKTSGFNAEFLYYVLLSEMLQSQIRTKADGAVVKNIKSDSLKELIMPIPPIEEQGRIVEKIEEILGKVEEYKVIEDTSIALKKAFPMDMRDALLQVAMQGKLTEQLDTDSFVDDLIEQIKAERERLVAEGKIKKSKGKKSQQNDYFADLSKDEYPYEVPSNWKITNIQNICTLYTGNSISESIKKSKYTNLKEGYNYIGTKDVEFNRTINYENGVKIPFSEEKFVYSYPNSTLLCIEGGSAGRKIAITKEKVCFGNKLCTFNPISINYKFLYYYLQSPLFLSAFNNSLSGIITGVSLNKIKELNIVLPPIEEQQRIVETLDRLLPLCETL